MLSSVYCTCIFYTRAGNEILWVVEWTPRGDWSDPVMDHLEGSSGTSHAREFSQSRQNGREGDQEWVISWPQWVQQGGGKGWKLPSVLQGSCCAYPLAWQCWGMLGIKVLWKGPISISSLRITWYKLAMSRSVREYFEHSEHSSSWWFKYKVGLQSGRSTERESHAWNLEWKNFLFFLRMSDTLQSGFWTDAMMESWKAFLGGEIWMHWYPV